MIIEVGNCNINVRGRLIRIAVLDGQHRYLEDPAQMVADLRECRSRIDLFTFTQRLSEDIPVLDYPMMWDNLAVIRISTFDNWWSKQIEKRARTKVRKSEKMGIVVKQVPFDDDLIRGIWKIYNECRVRQGKRFPYFGKSVQTVRQLEATFLDSSVFLGAFLGEEMVGFIKLVADERWSQVRAMNIVSMMRHQDRAPTNALIAHAVRTCAERGARYLVYGRFAYGKKEQSSLLDFKVRNGFQRFDIPRYYVPLSRLGWVAFQLGLYDSIIRRIPEPVLSVLRRVRAAWYERHLAAPSRSPETLI